MAGMRKSGAVRRDDALAPCRYKDKCPPSNERGDTSAQIRGLESPSGAEQRRPKHLAPLPDVSRETVASSKRWKRQAKKAAVEPYYPSHVRACVNNDLPSLPWVLHYWKREQPVTSRQKQVYSCGSYRCPSEACQKHAAHTDFARIHAALSGFGNSEGWVFLVLTIDQRHTYGTGKEYENEQDAFKQLSANTRFFLRRLRRRQKKEGWRVLENEWVGTIEVQGNGWPHMNLILYSPELAAKLKEEAPARGRQLVRGWLKDMVTETNWGTVSTAEGARSRDALAGYVVKLAGDFARKSGEIAKITQAPTNAKMKLRRIRAGRGFLPSQKNEGSEYTGAMFKRETLCGSIVSGPMIQPDQVKPIGETEEEQARNYDLYAQGVRAAMVDERETILEETRDLALSKASPAMAILIGLKYTEQRYRIRKLLAAESEDNV